MDNYKTENTYLPDNLLNRRGIKDRISSFADLPVGWYYGDGIPASGETVENALKLVDCAKERLLFEFEAFPGANGEIMVSVFLDNMNLDLSIEPDGDITAILEKGDEEIYYAEELSLEDAKDMIFRFRKNAWMQSDSSTLTPTAIDLSDLRASLSRIQDGITQVSQLLTVNAQSRQANLFATTSRHIIRDGSRRYSGVSALNYYPMASS